MSVLRLFLLFLLVLLQVTLLDRLPLLGVPSAPLLAVVVVWTWTRGPAGGIGAAVGAGLLLDLSSSAPPGVHALALLAAAAVAAAAARHLTPRAPWVALTAAAAAAAYTLSLALSGLLLGWARPLPGLVLGLSLGAAAGAALIAPLALPVLGRMAGSDRLRV